MTAKNRFCLTFFKVASASVRALTSFDRSPFSSVSPALSTATCEPVAMAMAESASAMAGASLTPSPAMATMRPSPFSLRTSAALSAGVWAAAISSIPTCLATAFAVASSSPVAMMMCFTPCALRSFSACAALSFTGSAMASRPSSLSPAARNTAVLPSPRSRAASASRGPESTFRSPMSAALPRATVLPPMTARTPSPVRVSKRSALAGFAPSSCALRRMASASGWVEPASAEAASARTPVCATPSAATMSVTSGLPFVMVPVLSMISVSASASRSRWAASLIRMPERAPRPAATVMDMGVAMPKAQGQAMISTETAATMA